MFENYNQKNPNSQFFLAIACAAAAFVVTIFFVTYLRLHGLFYFGAYVAAVCIFYLVMQSDHKTRSK